MTHKKKGSTGRFLSILLAAVMALSLLPADILSPAVYAEETGYDEAAGGAGAEKNVSLEEDVNAVPAEESGAGEDDTEEPETEAGSKDELESGDGSTEEPDDGEEPGEEPAGTEKEDTAECVCGTLCTADSANADCPVCGAEDAGIAGCKGESEDAKDPEQEDTKKEDTEQEDTEEENTEQEDTQDTGLCGHHPEHTADCGYSEEDNTPCGYECRICPIEDLIAALPDKVTEDNAENVREQLDKILDLYRELTGEEQEQIDISHCLELQAALDAANAPAPVDTFSGLTVDTVGGSVTQDENKQIVLSGGGIYTISGTWTDELLNSARGSEKYAILVKTNGIYDITLSNTTIETIYNYEGAFSIEVGASVNLTLTGENKLTSGSYCAGLHVPQGASLTIGGNGKLSSTGGMAGIGGGYKETNGAITIKSGEIEALSNMNGAGAGIGAGEVYGANYCNIVGDEIRIEGGTIAATGGDGSAGIGGGYTGVNAPITITGGTITATGGDDGAGIGAGGGSSSTTSTSDIYIGGTAQVIANGSSYGNGIGAGYLGAAGNITIDGSADVTANGIGHSAAKASTRSGTLVVSGSARIESTSDIAIGNFTCSDSPWVESTGIQVNSKDSRNGGIVFVGNAGTVYGSQTIIKNYELASGMTLEVPLGASLTIPFGVNLTGSGTLTGDGTFKTENVTADMISVPDMHYTSENMMEDIKEKITISGKNICGQTFMADMGGWTLSVTKLSDMEYTVTYTHESKAEVSKKVIILPCLHGNNLDALTHHDKVEADCTKTGIMEYWDCSVCKKNFSDQDGQIEIADTEIPIAAHTLTRHEGKEADCTHTGALEYWECSVCWKKFSDKDGQTEIKDTEIEIPIAAHTFIHHEGKEADCTHTGALEYWECSVCGKKFSDKDGQTEIADADIVISVKPHTLIHHAEVAAGCLTEGSIEYWSCDVCGKMFTDAGGTKEITDIKISAQGHEYEAWESKGNGTHTRSCNRSGCGFTETENCSGGTATYTEKAKCEVCGGEYGEPLKDAGAPTGEISISTNHWRSFLHTITFGLFFKETEQVTITAQDNESGVASVSYYISDSELTEEEVKGLDSWTAGNTDKTTFNISPDKSCVVYAKITDNQGNVTYISSDGLVFDGTFPSVTGVTDKGTYCTQQTVTVTDDNLESVTVNGKEETLSDNKFTLDVKFDTTTIVIAAEDKAGNVTTVTVYAGHNYGTDWKSDSNGHWQECVVCGNQSEVLAHTEDSGTVTKPATQTETGIRTYKCSVCGYEMRTEIIEKLPESHTHSYGTEWKSDSNNHWHECSCGDKSDSAAHTEDSGTVTKPATETETGIRTYKCSVCGYEMRTEIIEKLPPSHTHSYGTEWKSDSNNHWHECDCGDKNGIAAHTWDSGTVTVQPTTDREGEKTFTCTVCGRTKTETVGKLPPSHTHSYGTEWKSDSNNHWHECDCGDKNGIAAHTWDSGTVTVQPTTDREGEKTFTCTVCGRTKTETVGKLPPSHTHSYGTEWKSDNSNHWHECSCGEKSGTSAHTWDSGTVTVQPTTDRGGEKTFTCTVCGRTKTETVGKLPPSHTESSQPGDKKPDNSNQPNNGNTEDTKADTGIPFIKDEDGKNGWNVIRTEEEKAEEGSIINVDMNGSTVVPGDIFDSIKGKDITITFDIGNGIIWSVNGKSITTDKADNIDFSVKMGTNAVPVDIINNVTGERYSIQISLAYDGEFGFTAVLSINLGKENAGYTASLYYYNGSTGGLEFICADEVAEDGTVSLAFTHASDYVIAIDGDEEEESGNATESAQPPSAGTDESAGNVPESPEAGQTGRLRRAIIAAVLLAAAIGTGTVLAVRKKGKDENSGQ